jgi:hypothetical protein
MRKQIAPWVVDCAEVAPLLIATVPSGGVVMAERRRSPRKCPEGLWPVGWEGFSGKKIV